MKNSLIKIALVWGYVLGWVAVGTVKKYREATGSRTVYSVSTEFSKTASD